MKLKYLTQEEFAKLRYKQWRKQNGICPILKQKIKYENAVFDHCHKNQAEVLGEDGKGLLRGVLHFQVNSWEGKVVNSFKRYGLHKLGTPLSEALRNLAGYLDNPPMPPEYIHPSENPKTKKIGKRDFNKVIKYYLRMYPRRRKLPIYPKNGKMNKEIKKLLEKVNEYLEKSK